MDWITKQTYNLISLQEKYRTTGRAAKGAKKLITAIEQNKNTTLKTLLRNHEEKPIYKEDEIIFRDEVDFLLKFYSLLELSILSGYIAQPLPKLLQEEILMILGNKYIKQYYIEYYPILLPQILYDSIENAKIQEPIGNPLPFLNTLLLDKLIDDDIENFLWLLDYGEFGNYDMDKFKNTLNHVNEVEAILKRMPKDRTVLDSVFWGFLKYVDYLEKFRILLEKNKANKLLCSALWHFQGYWFVKIHKTLKNDFKRCVLLLESVSLKSIHNRADFKDKESMNLVSEITSQKQLVDGLITSITHPDHGKALKHYYLINSKSNVNPNFIFDYDFIKVAIYGLKQFYGLDTILPDIRYHKFLNHISSNYPSLSFTGFNIDRFYDVAPIFNLVYKNQASQGFIMIHFSDVEISLSIIQKMQKRLLIFSSSIYRVEDVGKPIGIIIGGSNKIKYTLQSGSNEKLLQKYTEALPHEDELSGILSKSS